MSKKLDIEELGARCVSPFFLSALLLTVWWALSASRHRSGTPRTILDWILSGFAGLFAIVALSLGVLLFLGGIISTWGFLQDAKRSAADAEERRQAAKRRADVEQEVAVLAAEGLRALTPEEACNARHLLMLATDNSLQLAFLSLNACGMTVHDVAAVFTTEVLERFAAATIEHPESWQDLLRIVRDVGPCVQLFAMHVCTCLRHRAAFAAVGGGNHWTWVEADPLWKTLPKVLLENEWSDDFLSHVSPIVLQGLASRLERQECDPHYFEYAFPIESLTNLSPGGARLLAAVPSCESPRRTIRPFPLWEAYGRHLALYRIKRLSDEVADILSSAQREILFGGLEEFPDSPGHVKLAQRLARQRHIVLGSNTRLSPAIADVLPPARICPPSALLGILGCSSIADRDRLRMTQPYMRFGILVWEPGIPDNS